MPHPSAQPAEADALPMSVGEYLARRLVELRVGHVFGVPGDYSLGLCDMLIHGGLRWVGTCNELNAGYAADAYGRICGLGACCVTYGVGGFSALNACAGAYAESVPLVVLSGAPASADYLARPGARALPHHALSRDLHAQQKAYAAVTASSVLLLDPALAGAQIDAALRTCLQASKPVLIELPMDVAQARPSVAAPGLLGAPGHTGLAERLRDEPASGWSIGQPHNPHACAAAVERVCAALARAERPALLCGVEVHRRDCQPSVARLARMLGLPVATTRHGKGGLPVSVCASVYAGAMSGEAVRGYVEGSDLLIILGAAWTDMDYVCTAIPEGTAIVTVTDGTVTLRTPAARAAAAAPPANAAAGGRGQLLQQAAQQPAGLGKAAVEEWAPIGLSALIDGLCLALLDAPPHGLLAPPRPPAPSLGGAEAQRGGQPLSAEGRPWPPKAWEGARRAAEAAVAARERLKRPPSSAAPLSAVASAASLPDVPGAENGSGLANGSVSDGIANGVANGTAKDGGSGGAEGGGCASLGYAHRSTGSGASLASSSSSAPSDAPSLGLCAGALGGAAPTSVRAFMRAFASWVHMQPSPVTVLADAGDSLFAVADMSLRQGDVFIAQGWYCSIGFTVPAALGAAHAHARASRAPAAGEGAPPPSAVRAIPAEGAGRRVACLVGDGAFQMTAQELSSAIRDELPITFFVLNNFGYGIERLIHEGPAHNDYNDVHSWDFAALAKALGICAGRSGRGGVCRTVRTEAELAEALGALDGAAAAAGCNLIEVQLAQDDFSDALKRLGESIKAHNKLS